jgi:hypothetical protein
VLRCRGAEVYRCRDAAEGRGEEGIRVAESCRGAEVQRCRVAEVQRCTGVDVRMFVKRAEVHRCTSHRSQVH